MHLPREVPILTTNGQIKQREMCHMTHHHVINETDGVNSLSASGRAVSGSSLGNVMIRFVYLSRQLP